MNSSTSELGLNRIDNVIRFEETASADIIQHTLFINSPAIIIQILLIIFKKLKI